MANSSPESLDAFSANSSSLLLFGFLLFCISLRASSTMLFFFFSPLSFFNVSFSSIPAITSATSLLDTFTVFLASSVSFFAAAMSSLKSSLDLCSKSALRLGAFRSIVGTEYLEGSSKTPFPAPVIPIFNESVLSISSLTSGIDLGNTPLPNGDAGSRPNSFKASLYSEYIPASGPYLSSYIFFIA